jgi:hypothetical protein
MIAGGIPTKATIAAPSPIETPRVVRGASSGNLATIQRAIAAAPADRIQAKVDGVTIHLSAPSRADFRLDYP